MISLRIQPADGDWLPSSWHFKPVQSNEARSLAPAYTAGHASLTVTGPSVRQLRENLASTLWMRAPTSY